MDEGLAYWRQRILPSLQTQAGFLGAAILTNQDSGDGVSVTYWESVEAMAASEPMGTAGRVEMAEKFNLIVKDVDRFELLLQDRAKPPAAGSFVRVAEFQLNPGQIDAIVNSARESGVSAISSLNGYRAALISANRQTGRVLVSTVWDTAADREASDAVAAGLRQQTAQAGGSPSAPRVSLYQCVVAEVSQAAQLNPAAAIGAA
jgi:heme-degrading monooxygenase HmoA